MKTNDEWREWRTNLHDKLLGNEDIDASERGYLAYLVSLSGPIGVKGACNRPVGSVKPGQLDMDIKIAIDYEKRFQKGTGKMLVSAISKELGMSEDNIKKAITRGRKAMSPGPYFAVRMLQEKKVMESE